MFTFLGQLECISWGFDSPIFLQQTFVYVEQQQLLLLSYEFRNLLNKLVSFTLLSFDL